METDTPARPDAAPSGADDLATGFERDGFVVVDDLLSPEETRAYTDLYDRFLSGEIDAGDKRSDLGAGADPVRPDRENITQIMWPSALHPAVLDLPLHARGLALARRLIGPDAELDFDMLIDKGPGSATPTPWHQDAGYWIDLPDDRAVSVWVSLDEAEVDSGCMWYVQGSHRGPVRPHWQAGKGGGALECEGSEDEPGARPVPLPPGSAAAHAGRTVHYSRGNSTPDRHRRAYILNYRPGAMIALERAQGMDHGQTSTERVVRSSAASS